MWRRKRRCSEYGKSECACVSVWVCVCVHTHMCFCWPESTVYVNKAPSWASIKPLSTQCLSLLETLMEICFCCRSSMSLLSPDGRAEKGKVWMGLYSFMFPTVHAHTFSPNHAHSLLLHNEINALSFPLCAQHLTVPKASCDQTPHHVLQLLILMLAQCSFCALV